jgi:hypothetical protein
MLRRVQQLLDEFGKGKVVPIEAMIPAPTTLVAPTTPEVKAA